jgi:ribosomal subunit interface protein
MNTQYPLPSRNITWRGHHIDLSDGITDYVEARLESLEKMLGADVEELSYTVSVGKTTEHHKKDSHLYRAEIHIGWNGKTFYAEAESEDIHSAVDEVRDEIASQIRKYKGRTFTRFKRGGEKIKSMLKGFFRRNK